MMKRQRRINTAFLLVACCLLAFTAQAQHNFKYQAAFNKTDLAGFYKINLSPSLLARSRDDLSDIRIADNKGGFVPYIPCNNLPVKDGQVFINFPQVNLQAAADTGTTFIIESKVNYPVSKLWLQLNNTAVTRTINLSGSDDLKKWFAIEEGIPLQQAVLTSNGTYLQVLALPGSSYHYFKLLVNDKNKAPVKFLKAGTFIQRSENIAYQLLPSYPFIRRDSNQTTYITIRLKDNYQVNLLHLQISAPKYYKRDFVVFQTGRTNRLVCTGELTPARPSDIFLSAKVRELSLQISNGNNQPLAISNIQVSQAPQYLVSYLEAKNNYRILTGDPVVKAPDYDLNYFKDSIPDNLTLINTGPIENNPLYKTPAITVKHNYTLIIWVAIAAALLLLSLLTMKMMKEVKKNEG